MTNADLWASIESIIDDGFKADGLAKLETYAEQFTIGRLVYQRFSPFEQHGCAAGGLAHVVATLLAGAGIDPDSLAAPHGSFQREQQRGAAQEERIERWAQAAGLWTSASDQALPQRLGEQIAEGGEAHVYHLGFRLHNARNWTFTTPDIYLSDLHDENVIRSRGGSVFVVDCDIRLNTPDLRANGTRVPGNEVVFPLG